MCRYLNCDPECLRIRAGACCAGCRKRARTLSPDGDGPPLALHLSPKGSHPPPALSQPPPTERMAPHTWVPSEEGGHNAPTSGPASPRSSCLSDSDAWSCSSEDEREVTREGVAATAVARALVRTRLLQRERETLQHRLQVQLIPPPRI